MMPKQFFYSNCFYYYNKKLLKEWLVLMRLLPHGFNNTSQDANFKGKAPDIDNIAASKKFTNYALNGLWDNLLNSIKKEHPNLIKNINGVEYIPDDTPLRRVTSSLKCFFGMPLDVVDAIARKFPDSKLNNAEFLQKYRNSVQLEDSIRAFQGLQKNGSKFAKEYMEANGLPKYSTDAEYCKTIYDPVANKFLEQLNANMADDVARYDTKKERFSTRILSGLTAAIFLGADFFNKAIKKGKPKEEAKKEQHLKQKQEIKENVCEAITQFAVFACFSKTINKSPWAPAIIGAGIGLVSRVISRLSSGMRITRMDVPERHKTIVPTMNEFMESIKTGSVTGLLDKKRQEYAQEVQKDNKKPVLSVKNILLFCAASITGGYALRFGKNHTKIGQNIANMMKNHTEKLKPQIIEEKFASYDELTKMADMFLQNGNKNFYQTIQGIANKADDTDRILLGKDFKTKKLFGKIEVKVKDLKALKTAPFRFVKELVSYPYKIANKLEEAVKNSRIVKSGGKIPKKPKITEDKYGILNLYKRFLEFEEKSGGDEAKLAKEFGNYIDNMILKANNEVTSSKGDNSKIAVMAQTLGTLTGMWFNMNDEFNSSIRNGSTKKEAQKDARLRGINKFFRMTVQIIISGSLNDIFKKQYNNSIASSALVVIASTILTDMTSRVLSGMPFKKMTKEELEKYQKDHKEGIMAGYYKMIDKLSS